MIKAALFDFDGTIADTLPVCVEAFRQTVEPVLGRRLSLEDVRAYFGPTEDGIFETHFPDQKDELLDVYYKRYAALQAKVVETVPGIVELIRALKKKGVRVALITAKGAVSCKISLDFYGITNDFEHIEVGGSGRRVKDLAITRVLSQMNVRPEEAVYIGDSPKDVISAHKANVASWSAAWLKTAEPEKILANQPERIFYSVDDLRIALEEEVGALDC